MKLLFAIKSLNVAGGGAERVLADVASGLAARGHDVSVLTFDPPGEAFYELDRRVRRIRTLIGTPGRPTPRLGLVRSIPRLRSAVREEGPDLVVAFMHSAYVPLAAALLGTGVPIVFSEHIDAAHYRTRPLQRLMVALAGGLALAKTVPSLPLRLEHSGHAREKVHVLPNAVDVASFARIAERPPQEPPVALSVGRFMAQKNHVELLRAFARVSGRFPDWTLRIVGDGDLRAQIEAEIDRLALRERVVLAGTTRDIASEYAIASLVVIPSLYESFGLVAADALAAGRPVLAFDSCLGLAEMMRDGRNGLLVSGGGDRVAALASGLEALMGDRALRVRLGAAGPDSVQRFSVANVVDAWEQLFLQLAGSPHRRRDVPGHGETP